MTRMVRQRKARDAGRAYSDEFKEEAVQMLLDGHRPKAVAANLGLSGTNLLYRWKAKLLEHSGPAAAQPLAAEGGQSRFLPLPLPPPPASSPRRHQLRHRLHALRPHRGRLLLLRLPC